MHMQPKIVAITGSPGTGKTILAYDYLSMRIQARNVKVVWCIKAGNLLTLHNDYMALALELLDRADEKAYAIDRSNPFKWLKSFPQSWLFNKVCKLLFNLFDPFIILFDGVTDEKAIQDYLPNMHNSSHGQIIITAREINLLNIASVNIFNLNDYLHESQPECLYIIQKITGLPLNDSAKLLCSHLRNVPGLVLYAARFIRKGEYKELSESVLANLFPSFEDYSKLLNAKEDYANHLYVLISSAIKILTPREYKILIFCAHLAESYISAELIGCFVRQFSPQARMLEANIGSLVGQNFLIANTPHSETNLTTYTIPRIVQNTAKLCWQQVLAKSKEKIETIDSAAVNTPEKQRFTLTLDQRSIADEWLQALNTYAQSINYPPTSKSNYVSYVKLILHCQNLEKTASEYGLHTTLNYAILLTQLGNIYNLYGLNQILQAIECYQKAITIFKQLFPITDKQFYVTSLKNLGEIYQHQGKTDIAVEHYQKALQLIENDELKPTAIEHSPQDARLAAIMHTSLAKGYCSLNQLNLAQQHCNSAFNIWKNLNAEDCAEYFETLYTQAKIFFDSSKLEESYQAHKRCVDSLKLKYGQFYPPLIAHLNSLSRVCLEQDKLEQAENYAHDAIRFHDEIYGQDQISLNRPSSYNNLGMIYLKQEKWSAALDRFEMARQMWTNLYYPEHHYVADCYNNIGVAECRLQNYAAAIRHHQHALALRIKKFSDQHPSVAYSWHNLADTYSRMEKTETNFKTAEDYFGNAIKIREKSQSNHPNHLLAKSLDSLASLYEKYNHHEQATTFKLKAEQIRQQLEHSENTNISTTSLRPGF